MSNNSTYIFKLNLIFIILLWSINVQAIQNNSIARLYSLEKNMIQLERISKAHSQVLVQFQKQFSNNQSDIDYLRNQIQENQHQLNQIIEQQKLISMQIDNLNNNIANQMQEYSENKNLSSATKANMIRDINNKVIQSRDINNNYKDINDNYNAIIALIKDKSRQNEGIIALQNFVKKYPNSAYQANANYWLGQLNYNKGKKEDAAHYFALVVKNYPKSSKSPNAMYKVGLIMQDKGDISKAKAIYQQVIIKYPGTDDAKRAQNILNSIKQLN